MERKLLLIVDPQIDFINGSLPVPNAKHAMRELAEYLSANSNRYVHKVVTVDWHPFNHCSFNTQGGQWPEHCIQHSTGAAIFDPLLEALYQSYGELNILHKGENAQKEEYSIFKNEASASTLKDIIKNEKIESIDICGIAGDVCVLNTLKDGISELGASMFNILPQFCPSLDGGKVLNDFINTLEQ